MYIHPHLTGEPWLLVNTMLKKTFMYPKWNFYGYFHNFLNTIVSQSTVENVSVLCDDDLLAVPCPQLGYSMFKCP